VKQIFFKSKKRYGSRRIKKELEKQGIVVSRKKISRLMAKYNLLAKARRKMRYTTDSNHKLPVAPNLLDQNFEVTNPNEVWVGDITYLKTTEGWLYLSVLIDLYSRKVIGWHINNRMTKELVTETLKKAVRDRRPPKGLVCHSDRGSQYCSYAYQELLSNYGFRSSMSRKAECLDNAVAESFFHSLKVEAIYGEPLKTNREMRKEVREYIEVFYNRQRLHSSNGYLSPCEFERLNSTFSVSA
jgi:putative transposase